MIVAIAVLVGASCTPSDDQPQVAPTEPLVEQVLALRLDDGRLRSGQMTNLHIEFPSSGSHTYGLESRVEARRVTKRGTEWVPTFYIITRPGQGEPAAFYRYGKKNTAIPDIGFQSSETQVRFPIEIPPLTPGEYRICKDFSLNHTADGRYRTVTACDYFMVGRSSPPAPGHTAAVTSGELDGLTIVLKLAASSIRSGGSVASTVTVKNHSGATITDPSCLLAAYGFALVPENDPEADLWGRVIVDCGGGFKMPDGFIDTKSGPTFPARTDRGYPLAPGNYLATLEIDGHRVAVPIEVTE